MRLNLVQNALHTIQHAVEHLNWSTQGTDTGRLFDDKSHAVEWRDKSGTLCFYVPELEFTRPPAAYNLKVALLHLIQGSELLLKAYLEKHEPAAFFPRRGSKVTINLKKALDVTISRNPQLFTPAQHKLLLESKDLRNEIEHYKFDVGEEKIQGLCIDFLALAVLLAQKLLSINLIECFSWDYLYDRPEPTADYVAEILGRTSASGRAATIAAGELWVAENSSCMAFLCLNCGSRTVSAESGRCMGCGTEGDAEAAALIEDFTAAEQKLADLVSRSRLKA